MQPVRFVAGLTTLLALYSYRVWVVLGAAFFGVVLLRGAYALAGAGDLFEVTFMGGMGAWLLVVSYRWFAVRWGVVRAAEPPAP